MRITDIVGTISWGIALTLVSVATVGAESTARPYRTFTPDTPGPHAAVVFVSGCSGFTPAFAPESYTRPAEKLRQLGFVVVWADFLGSRNLKSCADGGISQNEAARDAIAAARWLQSQPDIDTRRITLMGWSYGGGAVLSALASDDLIFAKAVVYYPYCTLATPWRHRTPVLVLLAGSDNVAPHHLCKYALETSSKSGNVTIINYPGAHHAFDFV